MSRGVRFVCSVMLYSFGVALAISGPNNLIVGAGIVTAMVFGISTVVILFESKP